MKNIEKKYRYPGTRPFTAVDKKMFFGRDHDIVNLSQFIMLENEVVLYGKSGLGKTSLLQAGVLPKLEDEEEYASLNIRFNAWTENSNNSPIDIFRHNIFEQVVFDNFIWKKVLKFSQDKVENVTKEQLVVLENLWYYLKSLQLQQPNKAAFLIVFDQFEELFTYPEKEITQFKKAFSEIMNTRVPQYIRRLIRENRKDFLTKDEIRALYKPLNIKVVFSIRSDKMSQMNQMKDYFPEILQKTYELEALNAKQGISAITKPASIDSQDFISPKFTFSQQALNRIIAFLSKNNKQKIETFQLQIICEFCENIILKKPKGLLLQLLPNDLGSVGKIFENYYDRQILKLPQQQQALARVFVEEALIFEEDKRRLSVYEGQAIKTFNINKQLLNQLVQTRLIRTEPHSSGGFMYELSHDTLVAPILESKKVRLAEEKEREKEKIRKEKLRIEKQRLEKERIEELKIEREKLAEQEKIKKQQRKIIIIISIAAIFSIVFGIFGFVNMKKAQKALIKVEEQRNIAQENEEKAKKANSKMRLAIIKEAILYLEKGDYEVALVKFLYLKNSIYSDEPTPAIDKRIKKCKLMIEKDSVYNSLMDSAKIFLAKKDYSKTIKLYSQALNTKIKNEKVIFELQELQKIIIGLEATHKRKADVNKRINETEYKKELGLANEMKRMNAEINKLISKELKE